MDEISVKLNEVPTLNASLEHIVVNNAEAIRSHTLLNDRDRADQHPISAITGLEEALNSAISEQKINEAVNSALATAKESGEFDGKDGKNGKSAYAYAQDGGFTGTEAQLSAKLAISVVTPQMYGGTDDVAIQAAINAADYVLLPEGNYTINNPVIIPSEKKIQIEGTVTVNNAVGFIISGTQIEICGNGTVSVATSIVNCSVFKAIVDKAISYVDIKDITMWGTWNYNNSNNHIGVEFTGDSSSGTCCYVNINCKMNCFTKAIWTHETTGQHADSWLTQIDVNSIFQNCLQAVAYEWGGGASRIRGVIQPKCTSGVTPNSMDFPLCILPEQTYMDAMVWDMHAAVNKYAVKVTGQNVTILSAISESYMDLAAAVKPTLTLRVPTESLATKADIEANKPTLNTNFRIDENGNLMMEENAPYVNLLNARGYKDGYRLNSSNAEVAQSGTVLTDFIPFNDVSDADRIRTKGVAYPAGLYCAIVFYDKNFNVLQGLRLIENEPPTLYINKVEVLYTAGSALTIDEKGVATIKVNFKEDAVIATPVAYFRLFANGIGSDLIITRNEEIVEYAAEERSIGKVRPENGVDYFTEAEQEEFVDEIIAKQTTKTLTVTYEDGTSETIRLVVAE